MKPTTKTEQLWEAAGDVLQWLNEANGCPNCGVTDGDHEPGYPCRALWDVMEGSAPEFDDYEAGLLRGAEDEKHRWIGQLLKDRDSPLISRIATEMGIDLSRYRTKQDRQNTSKVACCRICSREYNDKPGTVYCSHQHGKCGICDKSRPTCKCLTSSTQG